MTLSDNTGRIRKAGGNFKEKLRELGGLHAVFEVARNCHFTLEVCSFMFVIISMYCCGMKRNL